MLIKLKTHTQIKLNQKSAKNDFFNKNKKRMPRKKPKTYGHFFPFTFFALFVPRFFSKAADWLLEFTFFKCRICVGHVDYCVLFSHTNIGQLMFCFFFTFDNNIYFGRLFCFVVARCRQYLTVLLNTQLNANNCYVYICNYTQFCLIWLQIWWKSLSMVEILHGFF